MKRIISTALFSFLGILPIFAQKTDYVIDRQKDSIAFLKADWGWHSIGKDIEAGYAQIELFDSHQSISVVRYKSSSHRTDIYCCPGENRSITSALGEKTGAVVALNGSYFNIKTLDHNTFIKDDGKQVGWTFPKELSRVNGILRIRGHKIDVIALSDSTFCRKEAISSGPVLIDDGIAKKYKSQKSFYTYRHPRTMIGITWKGWVYMVVVDGRFKGQGEGTTIAEMVFLAQQFGLEEAINLDGGGSSTLWTSAEGVLNHPYDNKVFDHKGEREIPNAILVF